MNKFAAVAVLLLISVGMLTAAPYVPTGSQVNGVSLASLIGSNDYLQIGDKIFDHFTVAITNGCGAGCSLVGTASAGDLSVSTGFDNFGNYALLLSGNIGIVGSGGALDYYLTYEVHTSTGQALIKDITNRMSVAGNSLGFVSIAEDAYKLDGSSFTPHAHSQLTWQPPVFQDPQDPVAETISDGDWLTFTPVPGVLVKKDIGFALLGSGGFATLSNITQGFSQIPEPGFYGVLALGLSGLFFIRRRQSKSS